MSKPYSLILASASPRRKALLEQLGLQCSVHPVDIDETPLDSEAAADYVARLAAQKASAAVPLLPACQERDRYIIGSDTSVVLGGRILGKPLDRSDFLSTMRALSGRTHEVMTGVSLIRQAHENGHSSQLTKVVSTKVRFRDLSEDEILAYWHTGEPSDKAGGYGIQGKGAILVAGIEGSYSNVVGLPLTELAAMLEQAGLDVWASGAD